MSHEFLSHHIIFFRRVQVGHHSQFGEGKPEQLLTIGRLELNAPLSQDVSDRAEVRYLGESDVKGMYGCREFTIEDH